MPGIETTYKKIYNEDHGRIVYVTPSGDNNTGEVGNPHRPFQTLDYVASSVTLLDGDKVHVLAGTYTSSVVFTKGNVTYHFDDGVVVNGVGDYHVLINIDTVDEDLIVTGGLECKSILAQTAGGNANIYVKAKSSAQITCSNIVGEVFIELDKSEGNGTADSQVFSPYGSSSNIEAVVNVKYYKGQYPLAVGSQQNNIRILCNVGVWDLDYASTTNPNLYWFTNGDSNNNIHMTVGELIVDQLAGANCGFIQSPDSSTVSNLYLYYVIKKITTSVTNSTARVALMNFKNTTISNSEIVVEIQESDMSIELINGNSNLKSITGSTLKFKGSFVSDYAQDNACTTVFTNTDIILDGIFETAQDHLLSLTETTSSGSNIIVRNSKVKSIKQPISVDDSWGVHVYNSTIINDETVDFVEILPSGGNVIVSNSNTNTSVDDATVTEVGESIVRNSNFI